MSFPQAARAAMPSQADVLAAMRAPGFFGYAKIAKVVETHCSSVFLTGDRAYKVKKAIVLPFLDYGTLERRQAMCEEELRLNRRLAPGIYLGVRSVVPTADGFRLDAPDHPQAVEYVVEMRRFREDDTLAARLTHGSAVRADVQAVGALLARFHADAVRDGGGAWPQAFTAALEESLDEIERMGAPGERHGADMLRRFALSFMTRNERLLRARAANVRDGHGDLRAEHVILEEPMQIVDCVEFDPRLRARDVASDLAFLVMDLEAHGHPELAEELVTSYTAAGGDAGPPQLLRFYALERALVRAKVALVRAGQLEDAEAAAMRVRDAAVLLRLARRLAWQARTPLLLLMCGLSGSGKSYLSNQLALASGFPVVSSDIVRKQLGRIPPGTHAGPEHYTPEFNARTYEALGKSARAAFARGGVVVDATFRHSEDRLTFLGALGGAAQAPLWVRCCAPDAVLRERVMRRTEIRQGASDADLGVLRGQHFEPLLEAVPGNILELRTDRPAEEALDDLETWLDACQAAAVSL